jgi:hypothetical protein
MNPRPSALDPSASHSLGSDASERPSAPTSPPKADEPPFDEWPYRDVDPRTGRLRPISDEEWRARMEELTRMLDEIDAQDDTPEEVYDEFMRNIEAARSPEGETSGSRSLTMGPSKPGEPESGEATTPGVDPRTDQWWRRISNEEWRARHEEYQRRLAEIDAADDTPQEVYDEFMRNIDEERRRQGRPAAFEGYY